MAIERLPVGGAIADDVAPAILPAMRVLVASAALALLAASALSVGAVAAAWRPWPTASTPADWRVFSGVNAVPSAHDGTLYGVTSSSRACQGACAAGHNCGIFTWNARSG